MALRICNSQKIDPPNPEVDAVNSPTPAPHTAFDYLYPDIDPRQGLRISTGQRIALATASATLAFGAATGNPTVLGVGLILVISSILTTSSHPRWRIRREAHARFPEQPWQDNPPARLAPAVWLLITALCLITFLVAPTIWGGSIAATITAVAIWFLPGLSPRWRKEAPLPEESQHSMRLTTP